MDGWLVCDLCAFEIFSIPYSYSIMFSCLYAYFVVFDTALGNSTLSVYLSKQICL